MASVWNHFKQTLGSAVDITKAALGSAAGTTKGAIGSAVDITRETVTVYMAFLRNLVKWSVIVAAALLLLPIVGTVFHWSWMNGLYLLVLGLICIALLMAASPLVMLAQLGNEYIKPFRKMAQLRAGVAFWGLLIVVYFWLVPVWNYPAAIPLIFIICAFLAVAFVRFGFTLNPNLFFRLMLGLLVLTTIFCYMPASRSAAGTFVGWLDARVAGLLTSPSHPAPKRPGRIGYGLSSIDAIAFFDPLTGEPRVWYYAGQDQTIELFDGPGYHPQYKTELQPITPDIVTQIKKQVEADAERTARDQQIRREQAARIGTMRAVKTPESKQDVNPVVSAPPAKAQVRVLKPEDTRGEVEKQKRRDLVKGREDFIQPEDSAGDVNRPKKR
jgi:hypothetical protein